MPTMVDSAGTGRLISVVRPSLKPSDLYRSASGIASDFNDSVGILFGFLF